MSATCPRQSVVPRPYSLSPWEGGGEGGRERELWWQVQHRGKPGRAAIQYCLFSGGVGSDGEDVRSALPLPPA